MLLSLLYRENECFLLTKSIKYVLLYALTIYIELTLTHIQYTLRIDQASTIRVKQKINLSV